MSVITCPHCNAQHGFYVKEQVRGTAIVRFNKSGHYALDNGEIYDGLRHFGGVNAYCQMCDKYIGKKDDLISGEAAADVNDDE